MAQVRQPQPLTVGVQRGHLLADYTAELRPRSWLRWLAPAAQWRMSNTPATTTQNHSQPVRPTPGVYRST